MGTLLRRQVGWLTAVVTGLALAGCGGEPSSLTTPGDGSVQLHGRVQAAASSAVLTVDPRRVRLKCAQGFGCGIQVIVSSSSPVTLSYSLDGDFILNVGNTSCPQGGTLAGGCTIGVDVGTTQFPGRRSGILTISESTFGTSLTVRLAARVS